MFDRTQNMQIISGTIVLNGGDIGYQTLFYLRTPIYDPHKID